MFNTERCSMWCRGAAPGHRGGDPRRARLLRRLFSKLRTLFPNARLRVRPTPGSPRASSCVSRRAGVEYVLGARRQSALDKRVRRLLGRARMQARTTGDTATLYGETRYAARRWAHKRRIIMKAEVLCYPGRSPKDNPRFLVTNLPHRPATVLHAAVLRAWPTWRTGSRNCQQGLAMDGTSCSRSPPPASAVFLPRGYVLFQSCRASPAAGRRPGEVWTLRERLLKVAV